MTADPISVFRWNEIAAQIMTEPPRKFRRYFVRGSLRKSLRNKREEKRKNHLEIELLLVGEYHALPSFG